MDIQGYQKRTGKGRKQFRITGESTKRSWGNENIYRCVYRNKNRPPGI